MTIEQYVLNTPLPEYLNFGLLKEQGLEYIREMSSSKWSNLNESDPGVTILDQLCYALTELGYCIDFPMQDVLTGEDGDIDYKSQFFLPEEILTCSPVTSADYAKLILDAFPQIKNVQIRPIMKEFETTCKEIKKGLKEIETEIETGWSQPLFTGVYQVDLFADFPQTDDVKGELEEAVYLFLNRHRNVGELFLKPQILKPLEFTLTGEIILESNANAGQVLEQIRHNIANYLWPGASRHGYQDLEQKGETIDSIFNGPLLKNGWIETKDLVPENSTEGTSPKFSRKRTKISLMEISLVLQNTEGVKSVNNLILCYGLKEIEAGWKEIETGLNKIVAGLIEINVGWIEIEIGLIETGLNEIVEGWKEIVAGGKEIEAGWIEIETGLNEINVGWNKIVAGWKEIVEGLIEIVTGNETGWNEIVEGWKEIKTGLKEIENGEITVNINQAAYLTINSDGSLKFFKNNMPINPEAPDQGTVVPGDFPSSNTMESIGASLDLAPPLPTGTYRDIEDYYSIQNTFPEIYALGNNSPDSNASEYRKAQSKQLRGYLTVFDQLLANQFAQLAHVPQLFSFKQSATAPMPHRLVDKPSTYPVPYQKFSPTYFYQTLYGIPHVRPVLAGNDVFDYHFQSDMSPAEQTEEAWLKYKKDPYNQYRYGLSLCMEENEEAEDRRNRMLDHLLARHGEPATFYDEAVLTPRWAGSLKKTQIITKGLYLQNYQLLSYNRQKGHDFLSASPIIPFKLPLLPIKNKGYGTKEEFFNAVDGLITTNSRKKYEEFLLPPRKTTDLYVDFQMDMEKLERLQTLRQKDFTNFSTFELKLNLFFGLRQHYYLLISVLEILLYSDYKERTARKEFETWTNGKETKPFELKEFDITIESVNGKDRTIVNRISMGGQQLLEIDVTGMETGEAIHVLYLGYALQLQWLADERKGFILLETILLLQSAGLELKKGATDNPILKLAANNPTLKLLKEANIKFDNEDFFLNALMIFPKYVSLVNSKCFKERLKALADEHWPAHVGYEYRPVSFEEMNKIIKEFVKWHNEMRYKTEKSEDLPALQSAKNLIKILVSTA